MSKAIILTQYSAPGSGSATVEPARAATIGAGARRRYRSLERPAELATVDYLEGLWSVDAVALAVAPSAGVARYACVETQDSGPCDEEHGVLMIVAFNVPCARTDEVERWYRQEHAPMLLRAPGWLRMRRYEPIQAAGGQSWTHLALHELRDAAVLESAERALARSTPWRAQLEQESWFAQAGRFIYQYLP
jgi:hypothetical protein